MSDVFFIKCDQFLNAQEYKRIEYEIKRKVGNASVVLLRPGMDLVYPTQRWIPVAERLPENDDFQIVTILDESGDTSYRYSDFGWYLEAAKCWIIDAEQRNDVAAWMPLPEPWKGET